MHPNGVEIPICLVCLAWRQAGYCNHELFVSLSDQQYTPACHLGYEAPPCQVIR
jgi:hypothetical protein